VEIKPETKEVNFSDGSSTRYSTLVCTLPLNRALALSGLSVDSQCDPHSSVLVLNIGAVKGLRCPKDHWIYVPKSESGFHRVGFYSNVDPLFLPTESRLKNDRVSIYVERAYQGGNKPSEIEIGEYSCKVMRELQSWGFIENVEVCHPTWIEVAYTWKWPGSPWVSEAIRLLKEHQIYQVGRYGRWTFQGIADSIKEGFVAGTCFRD
jgi:protoporphyrinogen oxidase